MAGKGLSVKKNLDGVFSMDYDFVKVLHPCKSVAHLVSWKFDVGNIHINTVATYCSTTNINPVRVE